MQPDICIHRHKGNAESVAANERVSPFKTELRMQIYDWFLHKAGAQGSTCKEASRCMEIGYTTMSARISELKAEYWLRETGRRRAGAAVLVAVTAEERKQRTLWQ